MDVHYNRLAVRAHHQHTRSDRGSWTGVKQAELQPGDFVFFYACLPIDSPNCFRKRRMYVEVTT